MITNDDLYIGSGLGISHESKVIKTHHPRQKEFHVKFNDLQLGPFHQGGTCGCLLYQIRRLASLCSSKNKYALERLVAEELGEAYGFLVHEDHDNNEEDRVIAYKALKRGFKKFKRGEY